MNRSILLVMLVSLFGFTYISIPECSTTPALTVSSFDRPLHKPILQDIYPEYERPEDWISTVEAGDVILTTEQAQSESQQLRYISYGDGLTADRGVYYGPSGKETYYNLDMSGVIDIMRSNGFQETNYPYWIREDGVKMLGNYVMVAADLDIFPRGSIVSTSLGEGIVCDTGAFVYLTDVVIDIAVDW